MEIYCNRCGRRLEDRRAIFNMAELNDPIVGNEPLETEREFCLQCYNEFITWYMQGWEKRNEQ